MTECHYWEIADSLYLHAYLRCAIFPIRIPICAIYSFRIPVWVTISSCLFRVDMSVCFACCRVDAHASVRSRFCKCDRARSRTTVQSSSLHDYAITNTTVTVYDDRRRRAFISRFCYTNPSHPHPIPTPTPIQLTLYASQHNKPNPQPDWCWLLLVLRVGLVWGGILQCLVPTPDQTTVCEVRSPRTSDRATAWMSLTVDQHFG